MSYILIIGAKSDIAKAVAKKYAEKGYNLYLAARKSEKLNTFANDLIIRASIDIECVELDVLDYLSHANFYDNLKEKPLGVIFLAGFLGNQYEAQKNFNEAQKIINTNFTSAVSLLNIIADDFEERKNGFIIGVSSVAGDRGRGSNYFYGSAKAAFSTYLSGLRNRLSASNVNVLTVKPGFVYTKMTEGMNLPTRLTSNPIDIAEDIFKAQKSKKNILYTNWKWKWIMLVIKAIPERFFKKMNL